MNILDPVSIIETAGYVGLTLVIFSETGILLGFFLPGDSLLFTAGFLASTGLLELKTVIIISLVAAVLGDSLGYHLGKKYGSKIFNKTDSFFLDKKYIEKTERYFNKYGGETIIIARFMPIIRTIAPVMAGIGKVPYRKFLSYNIVGGILWTVLLPVMGYYFGKIIPDADRIILPVVFAIIVISFLPPIISILKEKERRDKVVGKIKKIINKK
ncbi:MAG: VTT domain-containing protein [Candidatus Pacebacteria bacterium]|nr:VTT domain-containing protein [Candidatus Paceibacterota bacterium]